MRATPKVLAACIEMKLAHWFAVATLPGTNQKTIIAARRNYFRLLRKYPKIAQRGGWTEQKILSKVA